MVHLKRYQVELQIGYDDFGKVRSNDLVFVDKTLFIKDILDNKSAEVSVITRPRRFGKTFNLSTLHYFLAPEVNKQTTANLFNGLKISTADNGSYMQYQGKFPVVCVSFKNVQDASFKGVLKKLQLMMRGLYRTHRYLINSKELEQDEKKLIKQFLVDDVDDQTLEESLQMLCEFLYKHTGKKVFLLIDEYDTPIQNGYIKGYYNEIINFMRGMLGAALKSNPYLERAVITGILRIAKESIFSDLNNLKTYSVLHPKYSQYFGFTEEEVMELLKQFGLEEMAEDIRLWYNGYCFGDTIVYNPWSIANCIQEGGKLRPYWANTSENTLIKNLLIKSTASFKEQFESLLQKQPLKQIIDDSMVFGDLEQDQTTAWSLLIMAGYLKAIPIADTQQGTECDLEIPNIEIRSLYRKIIERWLGNGREVKWYNQFLEFLLRGDVARFAECLEQVLIQTISVHDTAKQPEAFFHGFMLGLTASLSPSEYEIKSNRESGAGRYDIAILPKDISKQAIILELKSIISPVSSNKNLAKELDSLLIREAQKALEQIKQKQYIAEMQHRGFTKIIKIGLAFSGKNFSVASESV